MLRRPPVVQEPGHRQRIAAEPTGGRVSPPRTAGSPRRQPVAPFPPPSALAGMWARGDGVIPSRACAVTRLGPQLGRRPRARALRLAGPEIPPRPTSAGIPFLFPFSNLFSFN
jgi:hypothetical protein